MSKGSSQDVQPGWSIWKSKTPEVCYQCRRSILRGDPFKVLVLYDEDGPLTTTNHQLDCSTYRDRPRLETLGPMIVTIQHQGRNERRLIMADQETIQAQEDQEVQQAAAEEAATEEKPKKKRKSSKRKSSKKTSTKKGKTKKSKSKSKKNGSKKARAQSGAAIVSIAEKLDAIEWDQGKSSKVIEKMKANKAPTHNQLVELKTQINEQAKVLRSEDRNGDASQLSALNALVRRLERSARPKE